MLVIHFDPHGEDPDTNLSAEKYVIKTVREYRALPLADDLRRPIHRVYVASIHFIRLFVKVFSYNIVDDYLITMGNRGVYFLFLKNLFSEQSEVDHHTLSCIFQNSKSSFAC